MIKTICSLTTFLNVCTRKFLNFSLLTKDKTRIFDNFGHCWLVDLQRFWDYSLSRWLFNINFFKACCTMDKVRAGCFRLLLIFVVELSCNSILLLTLDIVDKFTLILSDFNTFSIFRRDQSSCKSSRTRPSTKLGILFRNISVNRISIRLK